MSSPLLKMYQEPHVLKNKEAKRLGKIVQAGDGGGGQAGKGVKKRTGARAVQQMGCSKWETSNGLQATVGQRQVFYRRS